MEKEIDGWTEREIPTDKKITQTAPCFSRSLYMR
jgi:hypothetical protein